MDSNNLDNETLRDALYHVVTNQLEMMAQTAAGNRESISELPDRDTMIDLYRNRLEDVEKCLEKAKQAVTEYESLRAASDASP